MMFNIIIKSYINLIAPVNQDYVVSIDSSVLCASSSKISPCNDKSIMTSECNLTLQELL